MEYHPLTDKNFDIEKHWARIVKNTNISSRGAVMAEIDKCDKIYKKNAKENASKKSSRK